MLTSGDVGDRTAAVDQVFLCSVVQTLEHRDCELLLHSVWNVEPVQLVVQQLCQSKWFHVRGPLTVKLI